MQLTYAFCYYFMWAFVCFTAVLSIFSFKACRRGLQKFQTHFEWLINHPLFQYVIRFSFAIIFLILLDSIRTFYALYSHFSFSETDYSHLGGQATGSEGSEDVVSNKGGESMIGALKEHREYYLAQRNIMLTFSALFVYFVFTRLLFNIRKLADEEHMRENPGARSVIKEVKREKERKKEERRTGETVIGESKKDA